MNGDGKVAIHRWFADGENWATHPWFPRAQPGASRTCTPR